MVSEDAIESHGETAGGLAGVGARLSSERKKQQIELEAVAGQLHLRPEVLRALEAGDEAGLPSPAFTRGYVRSYARLLGLEADELLIQLPGSGEYRLTPVGRAAGPRHRARPQLGKLLLWLLLLGILAGLVLYGVPLVERLLNAPEVAPDSGQLVLPPAGEVPDPARQGLAIPPPALPERKLPEAAPEENGSAPVAADAVADAGPATDSEPESESAPDATPVPVAKPPVIEARTGLLLRFNQDSWVEIDAGGRKLLVGVQPAGSERRLDTQPPVHVLLGNAPGVELIYDGKVMDTTPYRKGKVARITLGKH